MKSTRRCHPLFSDEDADLAALAWRLDRYGYACRSLALPRVNGKVRTRTILAHRAVLERMIGRPPRPDELTDHENRIRLDCRRDNLRMTDYAGNSQNRTPSGASGILGVAYLRKLDKWKAQVYRRGRCYNLGVFPTPEEAGTAVARFRRERGET